MFAEMRRALLLRGDKALFDDLWNRAEFHVPAAEKAKHPLPMFSILMCMNLEQEKAIFQLEGRVLVQTQRRYELDERIKASEAEHTRLKDEIKSLRWELEQLKASIREELLEIMYPSYVP